MAYVIFDLDHTVIDSSHRQNTLPDGSLDLAHWFENNTHEKIMADKLLPLADTMRALKRSGHTIIVCTARSPHDANYDFMEKHGLAYDVWLGRGQGCRKPDAELKRDALIRYFASEGFSHPALANPIMFEDNRKVIEAMLKLGVHVYDAHEANRRLAASRRKRR